MRILIGRCPLRQKGRRETGASVGIVLLHLRVFNKSASKKHMDANECSKGQKAVRKKPCTGKDSVSGWPVLQGNPVRGHRVKKLTGCHGWSGRFPNLGRDTEIDSRSSS